MKYFKFTILVFLTIYVLYACNSSIKAINNTSISQSPTESITNNPATNQIKDMHNSQNSLDWNGTYEGTIPCADCEGIKTSITLSENGAYEKHVTYLGKEQTGTITNGDFEWNETGSKVTLFEDDKAIQTYQVGENILFHLDREGNRITGNLADKYLLMKKLNDSQLEDKTWVLTELMGQKIEVKEGSPRPTITFQSTNTRISGNDGCNNLTGNYSLKKGNQIQISGMAATLRACLDMTTANSFNEVIRKVDNYAITDSLLSLNKARMAPLARFITID